MSDDAADWMARYCRGDVAAFHRLYALIARPLRSYLTRLVGDRASEDLLQQTFLKLHAARSVYVAGADPVPWIYTIARRAGLDELRRRKRCRVKLTRDGEIADVADRSDVEGREDEPLSQGTVAALESLREDYREALLLTKVHGCSHQEAAARAGTTAGAMRVRAHRGYVALRKIFSQHQLVADSRKSLARSRQSAAVG
jgi:RNA polymerase sigma-70 factor, ECF subfamily